ncbi:MAG: hypothetical protein WCY11_11925 [Novosphingobium sp.]
MEILTATATSNEPGPLLELVDAYCTAIGANATGGTSAAADWEPVRRFVADDFRRVGAYLEELDWDEYVSFLTRWAGSTRFEMTVFRVSEIGNVVIQEIEERHYRGEEFIRKNVVAVYEFNAARKIRYLGIYEQAKDTGAWIAQAARDALAE